MKEEMTQKYYDLLLSAGMIEPQRGRKWTLRNYCPATLPWGAVGIATLVDGKVCVVQPVSRTNYEYVYTNY